MTDDELRSLYLYAGSGPVAQKDWHVAGLRAVAAAERAECARVCEEGQRRIWCWQDRASRRAAKAVCTNLAAAIRARNWTEQSNG